LLQGVFCFLKSVQLAINQAQVVDGFDVARIVLAGLLERAQRRFQLVLFEGR